MRGVLDLRPGDIDLRGDLDFLNLAPGDLDLLGDMDL